MAFLFSHKRRVCTLIHIKFQSAIWVIKEKAIEAGAFQVVNRKDTSPKQAQSGSSNAVEGDQK